MAKIRKMYDSREDDWVYRLAKPKKERARARFAGKRWAAAHRVPRQGKRTPRTKSEAMYVYAEAQRGLANRHARTRGSAQTGAIRGPSRSRPPRSAPSRPRRLPRRNMLDRFMRWIGGPL